MNPKPVLPYEEPARRPRRPIGMMVGIVVAVLVILAAGGVAIRQWRASAAEARAAERDRLEREALIRAMEETTERIKRAGNDGVAAMKRTGRKLELERKTIGGRLTPEEAAEYRELLAREAKETVDQIGR